MIHSTPSEKQVFVDTEVTVYVDGKQAFSERRLVGRDFEVDLTRDGTLVDLFEDATVEVEHHEAIIASTREEAETYFNGGENE